MQNKYNFDDLVSGKVKDHETEFSDDAWENMQAKLDSSEKKFTDPKIRRNAFLLLFLVVTVSISFIAGHLYRNSATNLVTPVVVGKKAEAKTAHIPILNSPNLKQGVVLSYNVEVLSNRNQVVSTEKFLESNKKQFQSGAVRSFTDDQIYVDQVNTSSPTREGNSISENRFSDHNIDINTNPNPETQTLKTANDTSLKAKELKKDDKPTTSSPAFQKSTKTNDNDPGSDMVKRPISFGLYFGIDYDMTYSLLNETTLSSSGYACGAFINFPINDKISLQSGFGYNIVSNLELLRNDTAVVENDTHGKVYQVTEKGTYNMEYLNIPLLFKYKISPRLRVLIGPQFSYVLSAPVYTNTTNYKKDQNGNYVLVNPADTSIFNRYNNYTSNFNTDVSRFNLQLQTGLQWNMSKSFDLSLMYYIGLTNTLKNKDNYIFTVGNENNTRVQLRIGYKLFHKKFHED